MKRKLSKLALALVLAMLLSSSLADFGVTVAGGNLEFVPLIAVAPDDPANSSTPDASGLACNVPTKSGVEAPAYKNSLIHCYTPSNIYNAYGVKALHEAGWTGQGETIVIVDSYGSPTALHDLQVFSQYFGLPAPDLTIYYPNGAPTYNITSPKDAQSGWAFETNLDLQWAHAIAPNARLVLVAANPQESEGVQGFPSMFKGEQYAISKYPGSVISQSFAVTEQSFHSAADVQVARFDQVYQQAKANRVTVISAAGDDGTANGDKQGRVYPYPTAQWPASSPWVTAAGGTWLQYGWKWNPTISADAYYNGGSASDYLNFDVTDSKTEAVWKEDWLPAATGGYRSSLYSTPAYQSSISQSLLKGQRGVPDISWNAAVDGGVLVYTSFGGTRVGWHPVGGTSASTPQLAGLVAIANQVAHSQGKKSVGFINPVLYQMSGSSFEDVVPQNFGTGAGATTLDSNAEYGSGIAGAATTAGYDLTNGLGVPKADKFVMELVSKSS